MVRKKQVRFSDHFGLNKSQAELDFIDIPMDTDVRLYVDPYALHVAGQDWLRECGNSVVAYFELLVDKIRKNDTRAVLQLLDNFHEPNETHLGQSSGNPKGRGWGETQAKELLAVLKSSAVMKSGNLGDLGDYEMFIPGIGPDKISDLATNIIKSELIEYTKEQCELWNIPTESVNPGKSWDVGTGNFVSKYADLPVYKGRPIILVPKSAVRMRLIPSRDSFYSRFILDYLESELLTANDSLVKVLKSGRRKVFRKDLREKYPFTSEQIYEFAKKHPDILKKYKETLPDKARPISDLNIEWRQQEQRPLDLRAMGDALKAIKPGAKQANEYHNAILGILQAVFYPHLTRPKKEKEVNEGRKRIDIRFDNSAETGFFAHLVNRQRIFAPYISVECKNYSEDPENPEFDQLIGRFSKKRGNFGILVCRTMDNPELMLKRCRDVVHDTEGIIIVLDDEDIIELLRLKDSFNEAGINDYLGEKLSAILS